MIKKILPRRKSNAHKGDFGHVLVLAGSPGLTGAAYLTSQAALLSGSGLVTLGIPRGLNSIMERKLTEVMTKPLAQTSKKTLSLKAFSQIAKFLPDIDALAVGPGISRQPQTQKLVLKLLASIAKPLVLDADGINALIGKLFVLNRARAKLVITPHPAEAARILNLTVGQIQNQRSKIAKQFAKRYKLVIVLKGHRTVVAGSSGKIYINKTGNPGMASAGCGDILTGMIASLLGQGFEPFEAAKSAVYIHGLAGDYAAEEKGQASLIAGDILNKLPRAFKRVS